MQFRYPTDKVHLPNADHIWTISGAWDYAAKVCLRMSQMMMKFPPRPALDASIATSLYSYFMTVSPHTDKEITKFETVHRRIIKSRILASENDARDHRALGEQEEHEDKIKQQPDYDTLSFENEEEHIHTRLPANTGKVTKSTIAFLYGAIVCAVISRQNYNEDSLFKPSEEERIVAKAICTEFQLLYVDERMRKDWSGWFRVMLDAHLDGIGTARTKHATKLDDGDIVKLSRKQIQKKFTKTWDMARQVNTYLPLFEELFKRYGQHIKSHPARAASFALDFLDVQLSIYDQSTTYRYASVIHDGGEKCLVSPYESLRIVGNF
jgi:hypothetical protein